MILRVIVFFLYYIELNNIVFRFTLLEIFRVILRFFIYIFFKFYFFYIGKREIEVLELEEDFEKERGLGSKKCG